MYYTSEPTYSSTNHSPRTLSYWKITLYFICFYVFYIKYSRKWFITEMSSLIILQGEPWVFMNRKIYHIYNFSCSRSPDLSPVDVYLWRHSKAMVYQVRIQDFNNFKGCITNAIKSTSSTLLMEVHQHLKTLINMFFWNKGKHRAH